MKVKVNEDTCIGCGSCAMIADQVFSMQNGKSVVVDDVVITPEMEGDVKLAMQACPVGAISIEE
ncbi:MAG: ferredoxin [Thermoprotei archaeon]|nr:MAG: ferredoxin [Thermoprotei archaeon]